MSCNLGECDQNFINSWKEEEKEVKSNARYNRKVKGKPSGSRYVDLWSKVYNGPRGEPWMTTMDLVR